MAEHVADALEGLAVAQQMDGQRVAEGVDTTADVSMPALSKQRASHRLILLRSGPWEWSAG